MFAIITVIFTFCKKAKIYKRAVGPKNIPTHTPKTTERRIFFFLDTILVLFCYKHVVHVVKIFQRRKKGQPAVKSLNVREQVRIGKKD